jgi:predicted enzyme related to lactoylglutathione lyase
MPYKTARAQRSISTYGLTHIALGVKDPSRAFEFYRAVLGMFPTSVDPRPVARRPS